MLKKILAIATLLTLCLFTLPALAENAAAATATVTATGTGAVTLAPDRAVFTAEPAASAMFAETLAAYGLARIERF